MANIEIKFFDCVERYSYIKVEKQEHDCDLLENKNIICIHGVSDEQVPFSIWLDKSTAIKFAKTLRTEINKIQE